MNKSQLIIVVIVVLVIGISAGLLVGDSLFGKDVLGEPEVDCSGEELCGNYQLDVGESCDDGNTEDGDGCSSTCFDNDDTSECHNGVIEINEECETNPDSCGVALLCDKCEICSPYEDDFCDAFTPPPLGTCDKGENCKTGCETLKVSDKFGGCTWIDINGKDKCISIECNNGCAFCTEISCEFSQGVCMWGGGQCNKV